MQNVIVLFGKPGAGKGTRLSEFLPGREEQFEVLSVGNMLRKAIKEQTELGKKAEEYTSSGRLLPDDIINDIVIEGIKASKKTVILDGAPRTVGQAKALLNAGIYPERVINVYVDDDTVVMRARDRIVCVNCGEPYTTNNFKHPKIEGICDKCGGNLSKRKDDEENVVRQRLTVYREQTEPVLEVFAKNNVKIFTIYNTSKDAGEKFKDILTEL